MLHVKILYDAGKAHRRKKNPLKDFIEDTDIISYIKDIGDSREKFIKTTQYFEAGSFSSLLFIGKIKKTGGSQMLGKLIISAD